MPYLVGPEIASEQMRDYGGLLTFEVADIAELQFNMRVFHYAESLGGVDSLMSHPATMSHSALSPRGRAELGITDGLFCLSVGIEDVDDLIEDLVRFLGPKPSTAESHPA